MTYPITHGTEAFVNVAIVCSRPESEFARSDEDMVVRPCTVDEVQREFVGWETEVQDLLKVNSLTTHRRSFFRSASAAFF